MEPQALTMTSNAETRCTPLLTAYPMLTMLLSGPSFWYDSQQKPNPRFYPDTNLVHCSTSTRSKNTIPRTAWTRAISPFASGMSLHTPHPIQTGMLSDTDPLILAIDQPSWAPIPVAASPTLGGRSVSSRRSWITHSRSSTMIDQFAPGPFLVSFFFVLFIGIWALVRGPTYNDDLDASLPGALLNLSSYPFVPLVAVCPGVSSEWYLCYTLILCPLGLPIVHILVLLVLAFACHEQRIIVLPMMSGWYANIGLFSIILVERK